MNNEMKFYYVETDYINFLRQFQEHIWDNDDKGYKRPYIGIIVELGEYKYYAPLSSPKSKHKNRNDSLDFIRVDYKGELKAVINLNNLVPVSDENIELVDIEAFKLIDENYYNLLIVEMIVIRKKHDVIRKNAKIVYNIVTKRRIGNENLITRSYDFKLLESKCDEYSKL